MSKTIYQREYQKKWRLKNPDYQKKYHKEYSNTPEEQSLSRARKLKKKYGLTLEQYTAMLESQNGCCIGCGSHQSTLNHKLNVDHNHDTGKVRGLLCRECNRGIGYLKDSPEILIKLAEYLKMSQ
jgi:hypothetical protein